MLGSGVFIFIQFKVVKLDTLFREDVFSLRFDVERHIYVMRTMQPQPWSYDYCDPPDILFPFVKYCSAQFL